MQLVMPLLRVLALLGTGLTGWWPIPTKLGKMNENFVLWSCRDSNNRLRNPGLHESDVFCVLGQDHCQEASELPRKGILNASHHIQCWRSACTIVSMMRRNRWDRAIYVREHGLWMRPLSD